MHCTLKQEAIIPPGSSLRAQQQKFDWFREQFNQKRPHEALEMKMPGEFYRPPGRAMSKRIAPHDYSAHYLERRVSRAGTIRVFRKLIYVSNILDEDYVGLEKVYDLFRRFYHIGRYELKTNKIHDIVS